VQSIAIKLPGSTNFLFVQDNETETGFNKRSSVVNSGRFGVILLQNPGVITWDIHF